MGWREVLMGRPSPGRRSTWTPVRKSSFETIAGETRRAGRSLGNMFNAMRGKPLSSQRVCTQGHVVPDGSPICSHGHWVG
jgi:hypothetical protein